MGTSPLVTGWLLVPVLPPDWPFNTLGVDPRFAAITGNCCPRFRSCFCSWCRNRGGTSRGGYRGKGCCWLLAGARLALLVVLVPVEVPLELTGWGWLTLVLVCSGTTPTPRKKKVGQSYSCEQQLKKLKTKLILLEVFIYDVRAAFLLIQAVTHP